MAIVHVHTVMVVSVDTETGKVVGPVRDDGTASLWDEMGVWDPEGGEWCHADSDPKIHKAAEAAWDRFRALIATQGD